MDSASVLLLTAPSSYRSEAFLNAAAKLELPVVQLSDMPETLNSYYSSDSVIDFADLAAATKKISKLHAEHQFASIVSVDDAATQLAAVASERLRLPANDPAASEAARDKFVMRTVMNEQGVKCPWFLLIPVAASPEDYVNSLVFPCVVKPRKLSGSRGVIRANNPEEFIAAFRRTASIVQSAEVHEREASLLVEQYIEGSEVAVEGLITDGELHVLAIFDKPDPLVGPFFEETIYVTPSRHSVEVQRMIDEEVLNAATAVGLRHGPIHAELRINPDGAWLLEIAGRSIGGL